jgi:hypothetical protein
MPYGCPGRRRRSQDMQTSGTPQAPGRPQGPRPAVAVVGRPRRHGPGPAMARLPAQIRHRAHLPARQAHPGLGQGRPPPPGASRPLDLAHHRRHHPAPPRPPHRRRPPPALGTPPHPGKAQPRPRPQGFRPPGHDGRHAVQPAKTLQGRPRPAKGPPQHPRTTPQRNQEGRLTSPNGLKRKRGLFCPWMGLARRESFPLRAAHRGPERWNSP